MPIIKKAPIPTTPSKNSGNVGKAKGFNSQKIKPAHSRKRPIEGLIYGEELFESTIKKEKSIVVGFHPFTENELRISKDGKFIIERFEFKVEIPEMTENGLFVEAESFEMEDHWNLYYFQTPLSDFDPEKHKTYAINESLCSKFCDFSSVDDLAAKVIALVREEFLKERQETLEEARKEDKRLQEEKDKLEELEEQENESNNGNIEGNSADDKSENVESENISQENNEVPQEETQEGIVNSN